MRAFTTVSVSLCLFAFFSLSFAAPAFDGHKKSIKPAECEKGKRFYKDEHGKNVECHKFKDSKKDFHARGFNGHSSALSVSSFNITNVGNGTEIESSGSYQDGESGSYQYNGTANTGGNIFYSGSNLGNGNANNMFVPGVRSACKATTTLVTSTVTTTLSATPSDDGGDDLLHLTAIVNALPTDALNEIL